MGNKFVCNPQKLKVLSDELLEAGVTLCDKTEQIVAISKNLDIDNEIKNAINTVVDFLNEENQTCKRMSEVLKDCAKLYETTENNLLAEKIAKEKIKEIVKDNNGNNDSDDQSIWEYLLEALGQIFFGSTQPQYYNALGTVASLVLGLIPVVGMVMDVRDLLGDIYHLPQDGLTGEEAFTLALDVIAVALDFADAGDIAKGAKAAIKNGDTVIDVTQDVWKTLSKVDLSDLAKAFKGESESAAKAAKTLVQFFDNNLVKPVNAFVQNKWEEIKDVFSEFTTEAETYFAY